MDELIALTEDLFERSLGGESFPEEDLGTFGGRIKEMLEEAWPDMTWSSYPRENDRFGAEVHPVKCENAVCASGSSKLVQRIQKACTYVTGKCNNRFP